MRRRSIHQKLTRSYIMLIVAVALLMLAGSVLTIWLSTLPNIRLTMQSKLTELQNRLNSQMDYLEQAVDTAFLDLNDLDGSLLFDEDANSVQKYGHITQSLYLVRQIYTDIDTAVLFGTDGTIYVGNTIMEGRLAEEFDTAFHETLESEHGRTVSFGLCLVPAINPARPVLLAGKMVRYINNSRKIGYLYMAADQRLLNALYEESMITAGQRIFLCAEDGTILSSTEEETIGSRLEAFRAEPDRVFVSYEGRLWLRRQAYLPSMNATIVLMFPALELYRDSVVSILTVLLSALAGLGLAIYESGVITKRLLTPLNELARNADEIRAGNMKLRCGLETDDEIGALASSFNSMLDRIEGLMAQIEREQQEKLRTELAVQQNRIQPHFLYNALNSISALCEMGQLEEASGMSMLVAQYYRRVLSDGKDVITLEQEMKCVELYLQIVKFGKGDSIEYGLLCGDEVKNAPVPKMTLQPLVENAVKHAFRRASGNRIDVCAHADGGSVVIKVADNGVGMDTARFRQSLAGENQGHFGIYSVNERFRLLCRDSFEIEAESRPGEGTQITLRYDWREMLSGGSAHS